MSFLLAHLSDPHLPPLPPVRLSELINKRALGYLNWIRNRHAIHRREVLDALMADMQAQRPDHVAVTGDIVNLALQAEFGLARQWIEQIGAPDKVTLVPGNHDAYVRRTRHLFAATFADYLNNDGVAADASPGFPILRRRGPLALIGRLIRGADAAADGDRLAGRAQRDALATMLSRLDDDAFRVLLIHHPLRARARFKRLTDAGDLLAILKRYGVDLVLHGRDHIHSQIAVDGPRGPIPVIGVPSASALAHGRTPGAAYNLLSIARAGPRWNCHMRVRTLDGHLSGIDLRQQTII